MSDLRLYNPKKKTDYQMSKLARYNPQKKKKKNPEYQMSK